MQSFFKRLGILIKNKHIIVTVICLLLIIPAVLGAMQVEMKSSNDTMVSTDSQEYKDYEEFTQHFSDDVIIVVLSADGIDKLAHPDNILALDSIEYAINSHPKITSVISPAFMIKQAVAQVLGVPAIPDDAQSLLAIIRDQDTESIREEFAQVFPDENHALLSIVIEGGSTDKDIDDVIKATQIAAANTTFREATSTVTGFPVLTIDMKNNIFDTMMIMIMVAIGLMLLVLSVIFSVRNFFAWRWLPLAVVLVAIVFTFGVMSALNIPMTLVTMAAFPVLIGLGVDYAIQFHNRYDEEVKRGKTTTDAIIESVSHIGPAIGVAIIAACLGFAALFFSPVPMITDFGSTLIIGVIFCYSLSLFLLLALLYWNDHRKVDREYQEQKEVTAKENNNEGFVERGLRNLAPRVIKSPAIILPIAIALCVVGMRLDAEIPAETDILKFLSPKTTAVRDLKTLEEITHGCQSASLLVEADNVSDPEVLAWILDVENQIRTGEEGKVGIINSIADIVVLVNNGGLPAEREEVEHILKQIPSAFKNNLITPERTAANIIVNVPGLSSEEAKELKTNLLEYASDAPENVKVTVTGSIVIQGKLVSGLTEGREQMTLFGIAMVFAGLFVLFRFRPLRTLVAVLPIGFIIGWSAIVMYLMGIDYSPITATLGALIIGIGVEFTILLMTRYYEERDKGDCPTKAMTTAMTKIGRAIIASGFTVIGGFASLLIAWDFTILQDFGIITLINVLFALVSTLIVLPPLIIFVESRVSNKRWLI